MPDAHIPEGQSRVSSLKQELRRLEQERDSALWQICQLQEEKSNQVEGTADQANALLKGINCILKKTLEAQDNAELGEVCLAVAEEVTGSKFGFIGEIGPDGLLNGVAISNPGWEACTLCDQNGRRPPTNFHIHGLYGRVIADGRSLFTNDPAAHPDRVGLPDGHPPLTSFLGVPLVRDGKTIGMIGVGNREGGYDLKDQEALEVLAPTIVEAFRRKRAEEALRESELFYRQTLESIPGMVFTTRPDGYCDYQSQPWVDFTGVPMSEHLGDGWNRLLHPDDRPRAFAAWRNAVEERAPYDLEYRVRRNDGEYEWFKVRGRPIRNDAGEIVRWFGTALNINQLVQTQEDLHRAKAEAEAATRAKSEFLAHMSHEIRTPMAVFIPAVEYLLQNIGNPEHRKILEMADNSAKRLRVLIDNILDFSRIEARRVELKQEPFDVRACVRSTVEMFAWQARDKGLRLEMDVAADVPHLIVGDPHRLGQVLVNLLGNAVKFTDEGEIAVTVMFRENFLEFAVADTGIGIPEDKRLLVFRSYGQVDAPSGSRNVGSGLGLAISEGLVEMMGGRIGVHGRPGGGHYLHLHHPRKGCQGIPLRPANPARFSL